MKKLYQYTVYRQNGDVDVLEPCEKKTWDGEGGLYELIHCQIIQEVPKVYFSEAMNKRGYAWCDEEGLFNQEKKRNPHFEVVDGGFIVGDIVLEEVSHGLKR